MSRTGSLQVRNVCGLPVRATVDTTFVLSSATRIWPARMRSSVRATVRRACSRPPVHGNGGGGERADDAHDDEELTQNQALLPPVSDHPPAPSPSGHCIRQRCSSSSRGTIGGPGTQLEAARGDSPRTAYRPVAALALAGQISRRRWPAAVRRSCTGPRRTAATPWRDQGSPACRRVRPGCRR